MYCLHLGEATTRMAKQKKRRTWLVTTVENVSTQVDDGWTVLQTVETYRSTFQATYILYQCYIFYATQGELGARVQRVGD